MAPGWEEVGQGKEMRGRRAGQGDEKKEGKVEGRVKGESGRGMGRIRAG